MASNLAQARNIRHNDPKGMTLPAAMLESTSGAVAISWWRDGLFWLTLALSWFAVAPFTLPGYFWGANDARHHVYFLFEYNRLIEDGVLWPRWSPDFAFGFGYPFFNIYAPLSHFLAEQLLRFLGFSYTAAVESIFGLSVVGSAATMYLFVRSWGGRQAAMLAALVYVYFPYHLLNLYVRANLAESMAFVWMPLCLWTMRQLLVRPHFGWMVGVAVSYAGLMLTSNLIVVLFSPFLGLYALVLTILYGAPANGRRAAVGEWVRHLVRRGLPGVLGLFGGLGLSAIFWLPMALEYRYVRVDQWFDGRYDFGGHFIEWYQLFSPKWGFGVSTVGPDDPIGFQLGLAALLLSVAGVILMWPRAGHFRWEMGVLIASALISIFWSLTWAAPLWDDWSPLAPYLRSAQFPWRWLSVTAVAMSALAGLPLVGMPDQGRHGLSLGLVGLVAVVLLSSYPLLRVEITEPAEGPVSLAALMRFQQSSDEMTGSTAWTKEIPTWSGMADQYITMERNGEPVRPLDHIVALEFNDYDRNTGFVVEPISHNSVMQEVWYWSPLPERRIVYNHFYYPGWRAYLLDGKGGQPVQELEIIPEESGTLGRMTVPVPAGEGYVLLRFEDTLPRIVGRWISLGTVALLAVGAVVWFRFRRQDSGTIAHE
jgi:hypothetical protein